jgi:hypothetical protein
MKQPLRSTGHFIITSSAYLATHTHNLFPARGHQHVNHASRASGAVAWHCEAAFARQRHGAAGVDVVDPHPYAGDTLVAADAPEVSLTQRGAALRRRAVRRVAGRCRRLAQLEVLVCHAADGVGALHHGEGRQHGDEQRR